VSADQESTPGAEPIAHTCNPAAPGQPLPFGKRDPSGGCLRCLELSAGAPPRQGWDAGARQREDSDRRECQFMHDNIAAGRCICGKPRGHAVVCTYGDW
jgi:hypothetical protein